MSKKSLLIILLCFLILSVFSGCTEKTVLLPKKEEYYEGEVLEKTVRYKYDEKNRLTERNVGVFSSEGYNFFDNLEYDEDGNIKSLVRSYGDTVYKTSAEKKDGVYTFKDSSGNVIAVFIFDNDGRLISDENEYGYINEQVYSFSDDGVTGLKTNVRTPSGSHKLVEYSASQNEDGSYTFTDTENGQNRIVTEFTEG